MRGTLVVTTIAAFEMVLKSGGKSPLFYLSAVQKGTDTALGAALLGGL